MARDLLSTIRDEIDERLNELRPLLAEYQRLLGAVDAFVATDREDVLVAAQTAASTNVRRRKTRAGGGRRGSAAGAIELAAARPVSRRRAVVKPKRERAARGAVREAILAALEHGSHTVAELAVVTAMSGPNINGHLRKLVSEGAVVKAEREGKAAWALPDAHV
jgi:DNA-binding transcriptional ArsR family regulator